MITVIGPKALSLPASMGGNDTTFGLVLVATSRGLIVESQGDQFAIRRITDTELLTLDLVRTLVGLGADVLGYQVWFEFRSPEDPCPIVSGKRWGEAFGELHPPQQIGERWFQANEMTNLVENDGECLPASAWVNADVKIRTIAEVAQLQTKPLGKLP